MSESLSPERQDLVEKLIAHYQELLEVVGKRSEMELQRRPAPGEWSPLQQLEHQLMTEDIWTRMVRRAANENEPDLAELWATYRKVEEQNPFPPPAEPRSLSQLLTLLEARHQETLALLASIPDAAFARMGRNTGFGNLTVLQMFRAIYRHGSMHIDQIEGREPSFRPRRAQ